MEGPCGILKELQVSENRWQLVDLSLDPVDPLFQQHNVANESDTDCYSCSRQINHQTPCQLINW